MMHAVNGPTGARKRPDQLEPAVLAGGLRTDLDRGLSAAEARRRLDEHGRNALAAGRRPPAALRFARELVEPMSLLLIVAAGVSAFALHETTDAVAILAIVAINAVIAFVQQGRAERALEALREMASPQAVVIRDGVRLEVPSEEVVVGDVLFLDAGARVPADARVSAAAQLEVDESMLTGESVPVAKSPDAHAEAHEGIAGRPGMIFASTHVVRGSASAVVTATGMATEIGAIAQSISVRARATPLERQLRRLAIRLGVLTIIVAFGVVALLVVQQGAERRVVERAFLVGVALAVAAVPEGLAAVVAVALALGTRRMAERGAIIRRLPAVETLGATTVLATDKTGTLTENRMRVRAVATADGTICEPWELGAPLRLAFEEIVTLCNDATIEPPTGDPLEIGLLEVVGAEEVRSLRERFPRTRSEPFDAERRRMTTVHRASGDEQLVLMKGAPETVLAFCDASLDAHGERQAIDPARVMRIVDEEASRGARLLALASKRTPDEPDESHMTFVGLALLADPVRPEAKAAVEEARAAGVEIVMVTGDHPGTALAIANEVGMADGGRVLVGADLRRDGLPDDPLDVRVYARVDPDQKLELVEALQARRHVVAVTGDGVNDAPALKRADIGVALGRGADVAREAADLVITDDNLATIVAAIREGRGIYSNLRKVVDYLVACNISEVLTVVVAIVAFPAIGVPLLPLQLLWMNLVTDGLPALALGVDPVDPELMRRRPRPRSEELLDRRSVVPLLVRGLLLTGATIGGLAVEHFVLGRSWPHARSFMFSLLVFAQLLYAFSARQVSQSSVERLNPISGLRSVVANPRLAGAVALGIGLQIAVVEWPPAQRLFGTHALRAKEWLLTAGITLVAALALAAVPARRAKGYVAM